MAERHFFPQVSLRLLNDADDGEHGCSLKRSVGQEYGLGGLNLGNEGWRGTVVNPRARLHGFLPRNECSYMRREQLDNH